MCILHLQCMSRFHLWWIVPWFYFCWRYHEVLYCIEFVLFKWELYFWHTCLISSIALDTLEKTGVARLRLEWIFFCNQEMTLKRAFPGALSVATLYKTRRDIQIQRQTETERGTSHMFVTRVWVVVDRTGLCVWCLKNADVFCWSGDSVRWMYFILILEVDAILRISRSSSICLSIFPDIGSYIL